MKRPSCPSCGSPLFRSEQAEGRCSACGLPLAEEFAAGVTTEPGGPTAIQDEPAQRREGEGYRAPPPKYYRREVGSGWPLVRAGLALVFWGLIGNAAALALQVGWLLLGFGPFGRRGLGLEEGVAVANCLLLVAALIVLIGVCLCCAMPREAGARGWATGVVVSLVLCLLLVVSPLFVLIVGGRGAGRDEDALVLGLVGGLYLSALLGALCFSLLLRAAARFWDDAALGSNFVVCFLAGLALTLAVAGIVARVIADPFLGPRGVLATATPALVLAGSGVLLVAALGLTVWFLTLLRRLRQIIPVR